jgi:hypothetical protein
MHPLSGNLLRLKQQLSGPPRAHPILPPHPLFTFPLIDRRVRGSVDSGDNTASDPAVYHVKELGKHSYSHSLKGEGAGTRPCYIISWLNHTPADGDIVYDHAAVLCLHPSYLYSYARWGDGQTPFVLFFSKDNIPQRLNRYNSYFHKAWREHVHAYANRHVVHPSNREL